MNLQRLGKLSAEIFRLDIQPYLGKLRSEVKRGPGLGVDFSSIRLAGNKEILISSDPISYIEQLGPEDSARTSLYSVTADLLTSGVEPMYATFTLSLPPTMDRDKLRRYWSTLSRECSRMGIAIVAGHTGFYEDNHSTVIGSASLLAITKAGKYVSSSTAKPNDRIIMTKTAAIETTFMLARCFPETVKRELGEKSYDEAVSFINSMSVYDDSLAAVSSGLHSKGVTAMHDVAEGGVINAIYELAEASSVGVMIFADRIPVADVTKKVCSMFDLDPLRSLGEGSMLICCKPSKERRIIAALARSGVKATSIGKVVSRKDDRLIIENGSEKRLEPVEQDEYWRAFSKAKNQGLR